MNSKHTPGPWTANDAIVTDSRGTQIAEAYVSRVGRIGPDACRANAQLIAAAPDILSALIELHACPYPGNAGTDEMWRRWDAARDAAHNAIQKATTP